MKISFYQHCVSTGREWLLEQWDTVKNGENTPHNVAKTSSRLIWWKCEVCGHSWQTMAVSRSKGTGCPECNRRRLAQKRQSREKARERPRRQTAQPVSEQAHDN
ncbi:hypothetical protein KL86CLO1_13429 [uncultured Eubacteriales bacterium]|uniref:Treble clef zinc finger domain-containing protein n=1 Tax=uncultured Eubacteriales bacterium TaxID=172733 RepID=A0A212KJN8_9FIRM|nr:hypothetical protein KL86CLO1_13429 [uncultured Eubacteriales bacterium]